MQCTPPRNRVRQLSLLTELPFAVFVDEAPPEFVWSTVVAVSLDALAAPVRMVASGFASLEFVASFAQSPGHEGGQAARSGR